MDRQWAMKYLEQLVYMGYSCVYITLNLITLVTGVLILFIYSLFDLYEVWMSTIYEDKVIGSVS